MEITTFLAYLLIIFYFVIERLLRKGKSAISLNAGRSDRNSSRIIWLNGLFNIFLVLSAPVLNSAQLGYFHVRYSSGIGILLMLCGLILRYWAAKTLGESYTRTLQIIEGQQIITQIPYSIIRHPGYLGMFLLEIGASLAVKNWIVLLIVLVTGVLSRIYRIQVEEQMLASFFKEQYSVYVKKTWKLIPYVY